MEIFNEHYLSLHDTKTRTKYELMQEVFHIANLFYLMNKTNWKTSDECYVLSLSWFERWKVYTNFDFIINKHEHLKANKQDNESFFINTEEIIKEEVKKYFENNFLIHNFQQYPGQINNFTLLYENYLCHKESLDSLNISDSEMKSSYNTINIKDSFFEGIHYIIVSPQIWQYLFSIYGGTPIIRYKINISPLENIFEVKLMNINVTSTRIKLGKLDKPKLLFISRAKTVKDLKKYLIKLFSFSQEKEENFSALKNYRIWAVDINFPIEKFEDHILDELERNKKEYMENIVFPGTLLDKFESDYLGEIEDLITDRIILFEYKKPSQGYYNPENNFIFKVTNLNYPDYYNKLPFTQRNPSNEQSLNLFFTESVYSPVGFYDSYSKYLSSFNNRKLENLASYDSLFTIGNFFNLKTNKNLMMLKKIPYELKKLLNEKFENEISYYKDNLHLVYDKTDIINRFGLFYNQTVNVNTVKQVSPREETINDGKIISKYDLIMKKRKKRVTNKENTNLNSESIDNMPATKVENDFSNLQEKNIIDNHNIKKFICSYCNRDIDETPVECSKCNIIYYCNDTCLSKDKKFHNKKCKEPN